MYLNLTALLCALVVVKVSEDLSQRGCIVPLRALEFTILSEMTVNIELFNSSFAMISNIASSPGHV